MSISTNTISEIKKVTAHLDFLLTVANVKIEKIPEDWKACVICQEPYDNNHWKIGETANNPVKLQCGHIFGVQCLARLMFKEAFSNKCPLCRAQIIPDSFEKAPSQRAWDVTALLLRPLALYNPEIIPSVRVEILEFLQLIRSKWDAAPGKHMDRVMILYEEFIQQFCDFPPGLDDRSRALAAELQVQEMQRLVDRTNRIHERILAQRDQTAASREVEVRNDCERRVKKAWKKSRKALKDAEEVAKKSTQLSKTSGTLFGLSFLLGLVVAPAIISLWSHSPMGLKDVFLCTGAGLFLLGCWVIIKWILACPIWRITMEKLRQLA